jgi:hypothetical protein
MIIYKTSSKLCTYLILLSVFSISSIAATITVDDDGPADFDNIQAAIDDANNGDTIEVMTGTYTGPGNYEIGFLGKSITVRSTEPNNPAVVAVTIIDPNYWAPGFFFINEEDANSIVSGFTITRGFSAVGGGIYCSGGSPTIKNCVIKDCFAWSHGGGIGSEGSNPVISNCTITNNFTTEIGGGIVSVWGGNPVIENCLVTGNSVFWAGGGIGCIEGSLKVRNCTFHGNKAQNQYSNGIGGAIWLDSVNATIDNTILWGNDANDGNQICYGGIESSASINYCNVEGGLSMVVVDPCVSLNWGAGNIDSDPCFVRPGYWDINDTPGVPEDDFWIGGDYHLKSESGRWEPSIYIGLDPTGDGFINLTDFAAFSNYWLQVAEPVYDEYLEWTFPPCLPADFDSNGIVDYVDLSILLDDYLTEYPLGQWVLDDVTSPCIDAGDPNSDWTPELWPHGKHINMGAYGGTPEASMSLSTVGSIANLNNDPCDIVDIIDLEMFTDKWLYEHFLLAEDLDRNGFVDFLDYAIFADEYNP